MLINWRWDWRESVHPDASRMLQFHRRTDKTWEGFLGELNETNMVIDPVKDEKGQPLESTDGIMPIRVDARQLPAEEKAEKAMAFFEQLDRKITTSSQDQLKQVLYFFHAKYAFPESAMRAYLLKRNQEEPSTERKIYFFGNGMGEMYDPYAGLLDSSLDEYSIKPQSTTVSNAYHRGEQNTFKAVNQVNFNFVWNAYWYRTKDRLMNLRARIFESLIPGFRESEPGAYQATQALVVNLLKQLAPHRLEEGQWSNLLKLQPHASIGFEDCQDLPEFPFHAKHEEYEEHATLIDRLIDFADREQLDEQAAIALANELNRLVITLNERKPKLVSGNE